ncbi:MAG: phosphatidate cytidylyltransferase [Actinomycetota bacterium]
MDDHDPEATDELELSDIHKDLDPKPAESDAGFDGWLDTADPEAEDPYAGLAEDDAAAEIADWMAFTGGGEADESSDEPEVVVDVTDAAVAGEDASSADEDTIGDDDHDDTIELYLDESETEDEEGAGPVDEPEQTEQDLDELVVLPAVSSETGESTGDEPDGANEESEEPPADIETEDAAPLDEDTANTDETGEVMASLHEVADESEIDDAADDDTDEVPVVTDLSPEGAADHESGPVFDFDDFTEDHYLGTATRDHQDLAAAIVAAEAEDTEQVALAAAIPGLDAGVVGFDDVVQTEGGDAPVDVKPPASSDLVLRVGTAVALLAAFFLSLMWRPALIVLALAAFVVAAGEFYSVLIHRGYKPLSIFGFLGIIGAGLGTVVWGVVAIPIAFAIMITVILLFDAVSRRRQGAVSGFAVTILVAAWVGGLGAFAFGIIASDNYRSLVLAVVVTVALVDIAAYFVGRTVGRRPLAPVVSPKKTIEGFVGGTLMAFLAGIVASFFIEAMDLPAGLAFGAVVAVFAPLGDLAVSVVKRSLDIKDMGSILPGHGGLLDRIDAIIAVVPAAWAAFAWLGLL